MENVLTNKIQLQIKVTTMDAELEFAIQAGILKAYKIHNCRKCKNLSEVAFSWKIPTNEKNPDPRDFKSYRGF